MLVTAHGNWPTKHSSISIFRSFNFFSSNFFLKFLRRHHNVVINKTKSAKHVSAPLFDKFNAPAEPDEMRKQSDPIAQKSMKHYQLPNVPMYHIVHGHGQLMHRTNETFDDSMRNRSSIQKRAPKADWLSRNISMVLEQLMSNYENSYLPTHGQGTGLHRWHSTKITLFLFHFRRSDRCENKHSDTQHGPSV